MAINDIVFNMSTMSNIGSAIKETLSAIMQLKSNPDVQLNAMANEHKQIMERLRIDKIKEQNRNQEILRLLQFFEKVLDVLSIEIKTAKSGDCEGLPGFKFTYFKILI